jgi:hypothetical protein
VTLAPADRCDGDYTFDFRFWIHFGQTEWIMGIRVRSQDDFSRGVGGLSASRHARAGRGNAARRIGCRTFTKALKAWVNTSNMAGAKCIDL